MKEKIKKILFAIAEIGTVIWAVWGMTQATKITPEKIEINPLWWVVEAGVNFPLAIILSYFLSAVLILYLLRKYGKSNTPRT